MAAMSTVLDFQSQQGEVRTYALPAHTIGNPRLVIQKRKRPVTPVASAENHVQVTYGAKDATTAEILGGKIVFSTFHRQPANADTADVLLALADFRDIVNSDEFTAMVASQGNLAD